MQLIECHKHPRYDISIPVSLRLVNAARLAREFNLHTVDVCRESVAIAIYEGEEPMRLILPLLSEKQSVELDISLPRTGERISALGQARLYDIRSDKGSRRYLRARIFMQQMDADDRSKWEDFVQNVARGQDAKSAEE